MEENYVNKLKVKQNKDMKNFEDAHQKVDQIDFHQNGEPAQAPPQQPKPLLQANILNPSPELKVASLEEVQPRRSPDSLLAAAPQPPPGPQCSSAPRSAPGP